MFAKLNNRLAQMEKSLQQALKRSALPTLTSEQTMQAASYLNRGPIGKFIVSFFNPKIKEIARTYECLKLQQDIVRLKHLRAQTHESHEKIKAERKSKQSATNAAKANTTRNTNAPNSTSKHTTENTKKHIPRNTNATKNTSTHSHIPKSTNPPKNTGSIPPKNTYTKQPEPEIKQPNYYDVLGVAQNALLTDIKKAYRAKALVLHPDKNKAPDADEKFSALSNAYQILSDATSRQKYDDSTLKSSRAFYENATASTRDRSNTYDRDAGSFGR